MIIVVQISSRLYYRVGPRRLMIAGLTGMTVTTALFLLVGLTTDLWWIRGIMLFRGSSFGLVLVALQTATFATISPQMMGRASAVFNGMSAQPSEPS